MLLRLSGASAPEFRRCGEERPLARAPYGILPLRLHRDALCSRP